MVREQALSLIKTASVYLIAAVALVLPFFFLPITSDALEFPKQVLLTAITVLLLLLFGVRGILEGKSSFRRTPFDLPLAIIFLVILVSAVLSGSRVTSIIQAVPLLSVILFAFLVINTVTEEKEERIVLVSLLAGGAVLAILTVLQFLKIYILPYPIATTPTFSLTGSVLTATLFLFPLIPLGLLHFRTYWQKTQSSGGLTKAGEEEIWTGFFLGVSVLIVIGAIFGLYQLITVATPVLLPQETGLRTALQPLGLNFESALFGTGPGTYYYNFTRFKDAAINASNLWDLRFANSSSFFLEILSTLGVIGLISYLFLTIKFLSSFFRGQHRGSTILGSFLSSLLLSAFSFFLPFTFLTIFLLFFLVALYAVRLALVADPHVFDVTISVVALRKGLLTLTPAQTSSEPPTLHKQASELLPSILMGIFVLVAVVVLFGLFRDQQGRFQGIYQYLLSDLTFQRAIVAANRNLAQQTYDLQNTAINTFPQRDSYHRVFSQTNLALANVLATQARAQATAGGISQQDSQTIITLVQQSINFGRNAVTLSPLNVLNWENLTNVYRALIGFAQNADQFAIASARQASQLDPANPLLRVSLGGIYYQLGQYDLAIAEFATAINLKNDFANAHYNLGHAYEAKGDLVTALASYQAVRNLVARDSEDFKRIEGEIQVLSSKISPPPPETTPAAAAAGEQEPLQISTPSGQLPEQKPPVPVEGPPPPATTSAEEE